MVFVRFATRRFYCLAMLMLLAVVPNGVTGFMLSRRGRVRNSRRIRQAQRRKYNDPIGASKGKQQQIGAPTTTEAVAAATDGVGAATDVEVSAEHEVADEAPVEASAEHEAPVATEWFLVRFYRFLCPKAAEQAAAPKVEVSAEVKVADEAPAGVSAAVSLDAVVAPTTVVEAAAPEVVAAAPEGEVATSEGVKAAALEEVVAAPAATENSKEEVDVIFTVFGCSGHGKSTFLNALYEVYADDDETPFSTESSSKRCTEKFSSKVIKVTTGPDRFRTVGLVDTPEWRDSDSKSGIHSEWMKNEKNLTPKNPLSDFPEVNIAAKQNVLVWIVKSDIGTDREIRSIYQANYTFLQNVMELEKPGGNAQWDHIIFVINGTENFSGARFKALAEQGKLQEHKDDARQTILRTVAKPLFAGSYFEEQSWIKEPCISLDVEEIQSPSFAASVAARIPDIL